MLVFSKQFEGNIALENSNNSQFEWAQRSEYWAIKSKENPFNHRHNKRRDRRPLIICGHGAHFRVDRGTLFVKNGFTHYPQKREEFRYFRGDPDLPSRIIIIDASGSITFAVMEWLSGQEIPLIQLNWQGDVLCIANSGYSADPKIVKSQYMALENGEARRQFQKLIIQKFENSYLTLKMFPNGPDRTAAIQFIKSAIIEISGKKIIAKDILMGMEGRAAAFYFDAWRGTPIRWSLSRKSLIPADWYFLGGRRSSLRKSNGGARHPINAMLNYGYAVLHSELKMRLTSEGFDPKIGLAHATEKYRDALVLDHMEPLRPVVDREVLRFVLNGTMVPEDFTITNEGFCRLNTQLARKVVAVTSAAIDV